MREADHPTLAIGEFGASPSGCPRIVRNEKSDGDAIGVAGEHGIAATRSIRQNPGGGVFDGLASAWSGFRSSAQTLIQYASCATKSPAGDELVMECGDWSEPYTHLDCFVGAARGSEPRAVASG